MISIHSPLLDCRKMAAVPQAAFAASKVRRNEKHDNNMISVIEGKEKASKENIYNSRFYQEGNTDLDIICLLINYTKFTLMSFYYIVILLFVVYRNLIK